jgi:hypothetical protein
MSVCRWRARCARNPARRLVVAPRGSQDLRGHLLTELSYPRNSIVVLGGIPGAGKSTLLHRLFGKPSRCATTMGFSCWPPSRPPTTSGAACSRCPTRCGGSSLISFKYARIRTAIRSGAPLVVHDCRTRRLRRRPRPHHRRPAPGHPPAARDSRSGIGPLARMRAGASIVSWCGSLSRRVAVPR